MEISFSWFKSKKKKEMENLLVEEQLLTQKLKNKRLTKELDESDEGLKAKAPQPGSDYDIDKKVYKSVRLVNDVLTVVLDDGSILTKSGCDVGDFMEIKQSQTESDIYKVMISEEVAKEKKAREEQFEKDKRIYQGFEILENLDDFVVKGNSVYLKGIDRSLPPLLVERFAEMASTYQEPDEEGFDYLTLQDDEEYIALKRFFMWCCLNPRAEVANDLYGFLHKNGMRINKQGFFVALRNVVNVKGNDSELVEFISNAYNKIKGVWKKKPSDFAVYNDGDKYYFTKITEYPKDSTMGHEVIGNLEKLYVDLPDMRENRFTDNWTHSFDIRIGKPVKMDPKDADWSTADCYASGLHFAGHTAPYVLCGDTSVFVLINPINFCGLV